MNETYLKGDWAYLPKGCVRIEAQGTHRRRMTRWNKADTGNSHQDAMPICKQVSGQMGYGACRTAAGTEGTFTTAGPGASDLAGCRKACDDSATCIAYEFQ